MAYNKDLEERIDGVVRRWRNLGKKKMFGGICYLINGNMCFGIYRDSLVVRAGEQAAEKGLSRDRDVRPFDITGKPMKGWVMVNEEAWYDTDRMKAWLNAGKRFASSLPPK